MTHRSTDDLIAALAKDLPPVRVLRSPTFRAARWLVVVAAVLALVVLLKGNWRAFVAQESDPRLVLETIAILITGITAIVSAFWVSVSGSAYVWRYAALPALGVWILTSGVGCLRYGLGLGPPGNRLGHSTHCFAFIVALSLPLAAALFLVLRRARPLETVPVALTAALGVSAIAAFVLRFFHPFDITLIDLGMHGVAIALILCVAAAARRLLSI